MDEDTCGFYKLNNGILLFGPNYVLNSAYELRRETHEKNVYPVDGWAWFDSKEEARMNFNLQTI